jgi:hypothetical protein
VEKARCRFHRHDLLCRRAFDELAQEELCLKSFAPCAIFNDHIEAPGLARRSTKNFPRLVLPGPNPKAVVLNRQKARSAFIGRANRKPQKQTAY